MNVTVSQSADAPTAGSRRVDPGSVVQFTVSAVPEADIEGGDLVEVIPASWRVTDTGDGVYDEVAHAIDWAVDATAGGATVSRRLTLRAPDPGAGGDVVSLATFAARFEAETTSSEASILTLLVAPRVVVGHSTFATIARNTLQPVYAPVDQPLGDQQRFDGFRVRFQVRNPDGMAAMWVPQLEWATSDSTSFAPAPAGSPVEGIPFYVSREWIGDPAGGGGSVLGPESAPIAAADLLSRETDLTNEAPVDGERSMTANPLAPIVLPPTSFTEIEFSVRATADAAYGGTYLFRVTDAGVPFPDAVTASLRMGSQPVAEVTPGQQDGLAVGAPVDPAVLAALAAPAPTSANVRYSLIPRLSPAPAPSAPDPGPVGPDATPDPYQLVLPATAPAALGVTTYPSPHDPNGATSGDCAACHRDHSSESSHLLNGATAGSSTCLRCHNGSAAQTNVEATYASSSIPANDPASGSYYRHDYTATSGLPHTSSRTNEWQNASGQPILNRHSDCVDCHNSHSVSQAPPVQTTAGWTLSGQIAKTSGVLVSNGAGGEAPAYTFSAPSDAALDDEAAPPAPTEFEYQLCLKCHAGFTQLPSGNPTTPSTWALDKGVELNPGNASYHPVEAPGTNGTPAMSASLSGTSPYKLWNFQAGSTIRCANCHGDPTAIAGGATPPPDADLAPHASQYRGILLANYRDRLLKASAEAYQAGDFALCLLCHSEAPFTDTTGNVRSDTNFRFHGLHVSGLQNLGSGGIDVDTPGAGQGNATCSECHFRIHSTALATNADERANSRLVNFAPNVGTGPNAWVSTGTGSGTCTLTCHGKPHSMGYTSTPSSLSLQITPSPSTFTASGQTIGYAFVVSNPSAQPVAGEVTVTDTKMTVTCPLNLGIVAGGVLTCSGTYVTTEQDVTNGSMTDAATATNGTVSATARATIVEPLLLAVSPASSTFADSGSVVIWSYIVTNAGGASLAGPFTVTADHGSHDGPFQCGLASSLPPGSSTTCTDTYTATASDLDACTIVNAATATNGTLTSAPATATANSALRIQKQAAETTLSQAGDAIHYTYLIVNRGSVTVSGPFEVSDDRATVSCDPQPSIGPGGGIFCSATYSVTDADVAAGSVVNTARASNAGLRSNLARVTVYRQP